MRDSTLRKIIQLTLMLLAALLALTAPTYNGQWLLAVILFISAIWIRRPWLIED
jgi:hypothetical protein